MRGKGVPVVAVVKQRRTNTLKHPSTVKFAATTTSHPSHNVLPSAVKFAARTTSFQSNNTLDTIESAEESSVNPKDDARRQDLDLNQTTAHVSIEQVDHEKVIN